MTIPSFSNIDTLLDEGTVVAQVARVQGITTVPLDAALATLRNTPQTRPSRALAPRNALPPIRRGIHPAAAKALRRMAERRKAGRWDGVAK